MRTLREEIERRKGYTRRVLALFAARPGEWIGWAELAAAGGSAWRSRVVDARELVELHGHTLPWNRENGNESAYRFVLNEPAAAPAVDDFQLSA